jgi:hypothetical protein
MSELGSFHECMYLSLNCLSKIEYFYSQMALVKQECLQLNEGYLMNK